jgi:hypothetical protein
MKNLKSLQVLALAGVAVAFTSGCSSTGMADNSSNDQNAAYRFVSSSGWTPITDVRRLGRFPLEWNPVSFETYTFQVPVAAPTTVAASLPSFNEELQPGDAFVEAAGADNGQVKRVILYAPFSR